jgi:uncharacterized protein involved in exopolysaccharide biosynthesis
MAPEQKSAPENVDHRADIYSLGVVLYEMLTGELPSKQLEAPSSRVSGVHFDVRLDEIVLRALHTRPELRYHTALDLKAQLESLGDLESGSQAHTSRLHEHASARATSKKANKTTQHRAPGRRRILSAICLLLLFGTAINVIAALLWPRYYTRVLIEVQPEKQPYVDQPWNAPGLYAAFVAEQKRKLRAPEALARVAEELRRQIGFPLAGHDNAGQLARSIEVHEVRNTGLLEVGVYHRNPELAAKIANTVAIVYQELRMKQFQAKVERDLARLNSEVEVQRKRVQQAASERDAILKNGEIVDPDPDNFQTSNELLVNREIAELENRAKTQREIVDNLRMQLSTIRNFEPVEIRQVLHTLKIEDPVVVNTFDALNKALAEQLRLTSSGLGDKHPEVVATRALITEYTRQLSETLQSIRQQRSNKLEFEERALREITAQLQAAKSNATEPTKLKRYIEAKTRYIQARKVFEAAEKFRDKQVQHNLPGLDFEPAKIWERAEAPRRPSWPTFRQLWYSLRHPLS